MSDRKFHHGNLRAALLELAESEIEKVGYDGLLLRDLATRLGVSSAAPYKHYKNKDALLTALAEVGSEHLHRVYRAALQMDAEPRMRLRAACRSYLDFAKSRPELYRLMFVSRPVWYSGTGPDQKKFSPAFWAFHQLVAEAHGIPPDDSSLHETVITWGHIHGFAMLRLTGRLDSFTAPSRLPAIEEAVLDRACADALARPGKFNGEDVEMVAEGRSGQSPHHASYPSEYPQPLDFKRKMQPRVKS